ncbi:glycosyltransferase [Mucilaginibacter psychrotolerans]|uniref:Glycosyltransferase n=1 Tax=Mucilaginibacter psychrotolerans TaxID=1524096 RepID=A0A4Y8S8F4_9SPHI|nr:glycosyltransferase family 2 protein [Mucilaginibacter psychrotolerans]TFF34724.1 glycosyltransferase [Mucilaginibacter psychrotolerans]
MSYLNEIFYWLSLAIFILLALQAAYLLLFALAGCIRRLSPPGDALKQGSFAIYIPSYKEDAVIVDTAIAALTLNYPQDKRHIVVIADSLQQETLERLRLLPIQVVEVQFEKSTKAKALNMAMQQTENDYDYALILDADNVCKEDFLHRMNDALVSGYQVVQGQRVAKNTDTGFAYLDALSEGINNHIFRKGHRALGLSCAIIGSGVALDFSLFKEIMPEITAVGGFDKEMELRLLRKRIKFEYAERAIVYDEKIAKQGNFENQRRRWLSAQVHYMQRYLIDGFVQLGKGNVDFFDKVIQTLLLPRVLMLGITGMLFLLSLIPGAGLPVVYWFGLCVATYAAVMISVPRRYVNKQLLTAILNLPLAFFSMFKLLFKLKGANKTFIHTPHGEPNSVG